MVDFDEVSLHNIHRQIAFKTGDEGKNKAQINAQLIEQRCPFTKAIAHDCDFAGWAAKNIEVDENDQQIRHAILSILYVDRRENPSDSGVGSWRLEKFLEWPEKILEFHIWYLKEKGWIQRVDTGGFAITASGVEIVEENGYISGKYRLLTDQRGLSKKGNE
jgi:hypothetical protein